LATTDTGTRKDTKPRLSAQPKARNHPSRKQKSNPYPKILAITELRQSEQIEEAVIHAKREIRREGPSTGRDFLPFHSKTRPRQNADPVQA
jgi:hypothetical protein